MAVCRPPDLCVGAGVDRPSFPAMSRLFRRRNLCRMSARQRRAASPCWAGAATGRSADLACERHVEMEQQARIGDEDLLPLAGVRDDLVQKRAVAGKALRLLELRMWPVTPPDEAVGAQRIAQHRKGLERRRLPRAVIAVAI